MDFTNSRHQGKPLLNYYIAAATTQHHSLIEFLLTDERILLDVNKRDDNGTTCFQHILNNRFLTYKFPLIKDLFKRGYFLLPEDLGHYISIEPETRYREEDLLKFDFCNRLTDRMLIDDLYRHISVFYIIESARLHRIIGFRYPNWINFGVHAVLKYGEFWHYIEHAFIKYRLWDLILENDKKKNFQNKVAEHRLKNMSHNRSIEPIIKELFRDLLTF